MVAVCGHLGALVLAVALLSFVPAFLAQLGAFLPEAKVG
jgi:hypothetical protein